VGANVQNICFSKTITSTYFQYFRGTENIQIFYAMKKLLLLITTCLSISCTKEIGFKEKIKGNWHSGIIEVPKDSLNENEPTIYSYYEYVFTDEYIYTFSGIADPVFNQKYEIKKDSMLLYFEQNGIKATLSSAKIILINDNLFKLVTDFYTYTNYRLDESETTFSNYVIPDSVKQINRFKSNLDSFYPIFKERYNKKLKKYLKNKK